MKKIVFVVSLFIIGLNNVFAFSTSSRATVLMDSDTNNVLYESNPNEIRSVASISKIMTAIVAIESGKLDDVVTINESVLKNQTIKQGTIIDRYGSKYGNYTSPIGTSFEERALPYKENSWAYHKYEVINDINGITTSKIAPAFGQIGGGVQFELPDNVSCLIKNGFLKEIFW